MLTRDRLYGINPACRYKLIGTCQPQPWDENRQMRVGPGEFSGKIVVNLMWWLFNYYIKTMEFGKEMGNPL